MTEKLISLGDEFYKIANGASVLGDPAGEPAYFYARSSDKKQAMEGRESLSRQLLFVHEKAKADGRSISLEMAYWDVWRGKDADRPEFLKLLSDIKLSQRSDTIYIDQTDRLSRNTAVYYVLLHDLTRHGLTVRFESEEDDLVRHIKLAFDEIELERRQYRQVQANRARATKGHVTCKRPSFGYKMSDDGLSYAIDEEEAVWVRRIFDWFTSGQTLRGIAMKLSGVGIATPLKGKRGWGPETVRKILKHEVYKGVYIANRYEQFRIWEAGKQKVIHRQKPQSEWIYVSIPAIVSEEQWDEAQLRFTENRYKSLRNARKHEWLLSSVLRCVCGHKIACKITKSKRNLASGIKKVYRYGYYLCSDSNRFYPPCTCRQGQIMRDRLDAFVIEALEMMIMKAELWEWALEENGDEVERMKQHIKVCQSHLDEIDQQVEELLQIALEQRNSRTRQVFLEKQGELEKRRVSYEQQMRISQDRLQLLEQTYNRRQVAGEILTNLRKIGGLQELPFDLKRRLIIQLVDEIVLCTKEQWFEIRGVLNDRFQYNDDDQLMSPSGSTLWS